MATNEKPKSGWDVMKDRIHILLNLPTSPEEASKKDDENEYGNKLDNKPFAPAIPRKQETKPEPKKDQDTQKTQKAQPSTYAKGGKVRKTGMAKVHKGERVLTASQSKKLGSKKKAACRKRG